jgi:hypothetical protein
MVADDRVPSDIARITLLSRKHRTLEYLRRAELS